MEKKKTIKNFSHYFISNVSFNWSILWYYRSFSWASLAGLLLQKMNVVSSDSVWVKETKSLKIAKYVILFLVLAAIITAFAFIISS